MTPSALPRVTVAIPVYNSAGTLERCIRSAMAQTLADIQIMVADDGSADGSADIADRLAREDPRIEVLRIVPNAGKPNAMNTMAAASRGEWFAVLDADDAYRPARLETLLAAAEAHGTDMAADNLLYRDAGVDRVVRTGFDPAIPTRVIGTADLVRTASSYAAFDLGILKPVVRRSFMIEHGLAYYPTRLAEDFYYLMSYFVAGGRACLVSEPLYDWTLPFGTVSRTWTGTGGGPWRYDYRDALRANDHYLAEMRRRGKEEVVAMLERRSRQYKVMIHYLDAQRLAAQGAWVRSLRTIAFHPSTYPLLFSRVTGRALRAIRPAKAAP